MNNELRNSLANYPLCRLIMRATLLEFAITLRDYNFLQQAMWACKDRKDNILNTVGPIVIGTRLYEQKEDLVKIFKQARRYLFEMLVPAAIFPTLEDILLIQVGAMQIERTIIWDSNRASDWLKSRGDRVNHWLTDDIFVLCCIGQFVQNGLIQSFQMLDWFADDSPARTAYDLEKFIEDKPDMRMVLRETALQFGQGRWKAAIAASNKSVFHPSQDMRAFAAAGLDLVEFLPLLGKEGKTPSFGGVHDPIHQGGIAYFKV